jgi:hypothetical protein
LPGAPATPPTPPNTAEPSIDGEAKPVENKPKRLTDIVKSAPSPAAIAKAQQQAQAQGIYGARLLIGFFTCTHEEFSERHKVSLLHWQLD